MDFKGKPARNIALVNATIDRIPFLKVWLASCAWRVKCCGSESNSNASGMSVVMETNGGVSHDTVALAPPFSCSNARYCPLI